jgi:hypothetical protein
MLTVDEIFKQLGFESEAEFHRMVAGADLSSVERIAAFKHWQDEDGSKAGLEALSPTPNTRDSPDQR